VRNQTLFLKPIEIFRTTFGARRWDFQTGWRGVAAALMSNMFISLSLLAAAVSFVCYWHSNYHIDIDIMEEQRWLFCCCNVAKLMHENLHFYILLVQQDTKLNFTFSVQDWETSWCMCSWWARDILKIWLVGSALGEWALVGSALGIHLFVVSLHSQFRIGDKLIHLLS